MTILILTSRQQYPYHLFLAETLMKLLAKDRHSVSILDVSSHNRDSLYLQSIQKLSPDVLITLDLAGFHFRTQTKENALNMLPSKNLNLLWGNKEEYAPLLCGKISLSMLFYDVSGKNCHLPKHYPNLHYYKADKDFFMDVRTPEPEGIQKAFRLIWKDFTGEVLLSET